MSLTLPDELVYFLDLVGFVWPKADEGKLWDESEAWQKLASALDTVTKTADGAAKSVPEHNQGPTIDAFVEYWRLYVDDPGHLDNAVLADNLIGYGLAGSALIILLLKIAVIIQLIVLAIVWAVAWATSELTLGASLAYAWEATAEVRLAVRSAVNTAVLALDELGPAALDVAEEKIGGIIARLHQAEAALPWNEGRDPARNYRYLDPELVAQLEADGVKFSADGMLAVGRDPSGRIIFLEKGSDRAGLQHIVKEHAKEFAQRGIPQDQIPDVIMKAVTEGRVVGHQGKKNPPRPIYEFEYHGHTYRMALEIGSNGYVVSANFKSSGK